MIKNLSQLKKVIKTEPCFEIVNHVRKECIGQIRKVNVVQTNGFYSVIKDNPHHSVSRGNEGKGSWLAFEKASNWLFMPNGVISCYIGNTKTKENLIIAFRILNE